MQMNNLCRWCQSGLKFILCAKMIFSVHWLHCWQIALYKSSNCVFSVLHITHTEGTCVHWSLKLSIIDYLLFLAQVKMQSS